MKETIAYLKSILKDNDTVILGLSGGPDSMCLLNILENLNIDIKIICAHINHNIREESKEEIKFIEEYCSNKRIILETTTFEKKGIDIDYSESELREKRYDYFYTLVKKYKASYLFTAHHGDDLIETILMRLTRGSNLKGYTGFLTETDKGDFKIIKPLIYMTKKDIEKYNKENKIPFVTDKTNKLDKYTRNRYRNHILPFLKEENENVHLKYLKFSKELYSYYEFVDRTVVKELNSRLKKDTLNIKGFEDLDFLIQTKIIERLLSNNYIDNLYLVSDKHIRIILDLIANPRPNIEINLPDNIHIVKSYDKLKITKGKESKTEYKIKIEDVTELPNGRKIEMLSETTKNTNDYIKLNSNDIKLPLYIRTRKTGDKMLVKNMSNPKKVKDIFIDCKISKEEREKQPILVDSNDVILWIPGIKKSNFDKEKNDNYDIILWYN